DRRQRLPVAPVQVEETGIGRDVEGQFPEAVVRGVHCSDALSQQGLCPQGARSHAVFAMQRCTTKRESCRPGAEMREKSGPCEKAPCGQRNRSNSGFLTSRAAAPAEPGVYCTPRTIAAATALSFSMTRPAAAAT